MKYYVNPNLNTDQDKPVEKKKKLKKKKQESVISKKDYGLTESAKILLEHKACQEV